MNSAVIHVPVDDADISSPCEWRAPVNLFAEFSAPPYEASDLPLSLSAYPALYAAAGGLDRTLALTAAVATAAAAISDEFQIEADARTAWRQSSRLWLLAVARPGSAKTPVQKEMMAPLWAIAGRLRKDWQSECSQSESKPPYPRLIVSDCTVEALSTALVENPRGLLAAFDEFESWLGGMDAYRKSGASRDRGEWLRLFDGGPHTIERVQRGTLFVPNWGVSILSASTPAALAKLARHLPEDGLLQRFIIAIGRRPIFDPQPAEGIEAARASYRETIERLYALNPRDSRRVVSLSPDAKQRFETWRRDHALAQEAMGSLDSALESHMAKHPQMLLRLALVFHCSSIVNLPNPASRDPAAWPVSLETIDIAIRFMQRATRHATALYINSTGRSPVYELAQDVARAILATPEPLIARRELVQRVRAFRAADATTQAGALQVLVDADWLAPAEGGYAKPYPTRFHVNPQLAEQFAALAERERERRAVVREAIRAASAERSHA